MCQISSRNLALLYYPETVENFTPGQPSQSVTVAVQPIRSLYTLDSQLPPVDSLFITGPPKSPSFPYKNKSPCLVLGICLWFTIAYISQRRRQEHPTPVLLPGKSHGRRSLVGCSPWGRYESGTTERLHFHFWLSYIGEGNGNPPQCSCLENPRDGGAWWAAVYGVAQSRTRLKWLSSSSTFPKLQSPPLLPCKLNFASKITGYYIVKVNRINKMWYIHNEILFHHKKEWSIDTCFNMDGSWM